MEKHDLRHEFPGMEDKIHSLKMTDAHFKKLFDEYHEVNTATHRFEMGGENVSDEVLNEYRIKRVHLKDQLFELLKN